MDISKNIIRIRTEKKIKQAEISETLNIEPSNYSRLEKRGDKLTIEQLKKIADALGVHYLELLGEEVGSRQTQDLENEIKRLNEEIKLLKPLAEMANQGIEKNGMKDFVAFIFGMVIIKSILNNNQDQTTDTEEPKPKTDEEIQRPIKKISERYL